MLPVELGEFSVFCAKRIKGVQGLDISKGMIELAKRQVLDNGLISLRFEYHDVENISCADSTFSVVQCKSAFHHMENYPQVFREMMRCCKPKGKLSVQDIMAYDDRKVNSFVEALEKEVDASHHVTLSRQEFVNLFEEDQVEVIRPLTVETELNFHEYLNHAFQSEARLENIRDLLDEGLKDQDIPRFLYMKGSELILNRGVFLILGQKIQP